MEKFVKKSGLVVLLDRSNVDTDQIIPKQFLKKIERSGFGIHLFHDWRFLDDQGTQEKPDFFLNQKRYRGAQILVTRDNFGCGSSREHAPWAIQDFGIRIIIAPSYADIFYNNCFKIGILPVVLQTEEVQSIFSYVSEQIGAEILVDLEKQTVSLAENIIFNFDVDGFRKECLLKGWDDIGLTMRHVDKISDFERQREERFAFIDSGVQNK